MRAIVGVLVSGAVVASAPVAHAFCFYNGIYNAKTTIAEEFNDSKWVVRARVLAAKDHWSDVTDSWTTYYLTVLHAYKGAPPQKIRFFTYRDSGGFYMDRPWVKPPREHDIGGEYLLFLGPFPGQHDAPSAARGAVFVNYNCGVSGPWSDVRASDRELLTELRRER